MRHPIVSMLALALLAMQGCAGNYIQPELGARKADIITEGKYQFKDLNKNGSLDKYEDWRLPQEERIADLVSQMTLEEKAGLMFHPNMAVNESGEIKYDLSDDEKAALAGAQEQRYAGPIGPGGQNAGAMGFGQMRASATAKSYIEELGFRCILNNGVAEPAKFANWSNGMQEIAEASRLGIPIVFSSDPRHSAKLGGHVSGRQYFSHIANGEGQVGITAGRDIEMMKKYGEVMAAEFRAVGLHMFLGPQVDVITDPRWSRNMGCFSEDADLTAEMVEAFMDGAQGTDVGADKILVHLKHWPGSGPHRDGGGSWLYYPSNNQEYHYKPWVAGIKKGALAAMGYYSGTFSDSLNVNFSYHISTEVLKEQLGFKGAICTDWGVSRNGPMHPKYEENPPSLKDNYGMIFNAGVDQIGSDTNPNYVVELVNEGVIPMSRINDAVSRILQWHFSLGLFENPYVDPEKAASILQCEEFEAFGLKCQETSNVLLANNGVLPAKEGSRIFVDGIAPDVAEAYGTVVDNPEDADIIIYRTDFSQERPAGGPFGGFGPGPGGARPKMRGPADWKINEKIDDIDIAFPESKVEKLKNYVATGKPVVADLNTTGSSCVITPEVKELPAALMLSFDPTDKAVMEVLFGKFSPVGKLPFEIPSSMDAVRAQLEDKPYDSADPTFPFGFGLSY
ncbi:MAG: glycoside hydrolase family 3 N-terminal domain-containing protein [Bacteroidia bacterium]|nr:glycoside hydrolase family 3 N-terminal domain-containing protein [Bacteroidia bacterium]